MQNNWNQFGNKRFEKLALETTAFNNCHLDVSDVNFEIGKNSYSLKVAAMLAGMAVVIGGRILSGRVGR